MVDIEAAFLNEDLESCSPVNAEWPEGQSRTGQLHGRRKKKYCIKLIKAMSCGLMLVLMKSGRLKSHFDGSSTSG